MTAYWDGKARQVRDLAGGGEEEQLADQEFLERVGAVENDVIRTVTLLTGDREFPDSMRERIQRIVAMKRVSFPPDEDLVAMGARERVLRSRYSVLIEDLHSAFHDVARMRHETRFGVLSDDPESTLRRRDTHDQEAHREG